jgi:hypothetical protein
MSDLWFAEFLLKCWIAVAVSVLGLIALGIIGLALR